MEEGQDSRSPRRDGTGQDPRRPSPLRMLRDRARLFLQEHITTVLERVDETFFDLAENADSANEQTLYYDAMRKLRSRRKTLESEFLGGASEGFDSLGAADNGHWDTGIDASELQVLDNDELEEMIAFDNMVSRATEACQPDLDQLNHRICHAMNFPLVEKRNPFFPELISESFVRQLRILDIRLKPKLVLLKLFERYVLREWPRYIGDSNQLLKDMGILPNLDEKPPKPKPEPKPAPQAGDGSGRNGAGREGSATVSGEVAEPRQDWQELAKEQTPEKSEPTTSQPQRASKSSSGGVRDRFYGELLGELHAALGHDGQEEAAGTGGQRLEVDDLLEAITDLQTGADMEVVLDFLAERGLENFLEEKLAAANQSLSSLDAMDRSIIRVMDNLFQYIGNRELVPKELDRLILRLELPVTRLALRDPHFLEQQKHPGRRLINELIRASNGFMEGEDLDNDPLYDKVQEVIESLSRIEANVREITALLTEFIDFVDKDRRRLMVREQRILQEEEAQERINEAHTRIAEEMHQRLHHHHFPRAVVEFAEKGWSKVLFFAYLKRGTASDEWLNGLYLLDQLLETVAPAPQRRSLAADREHCQQLIETLRQRLADVAVDNYEAGRYLGAIEQLLESRRESDGNAPAPADEALQDQYIEDLVVDLPGMRRTQPAFQEEAGAGALEAVDALRRGTWVEFRDEGEQPVRCKLVGVIKPTTKHIFTNRKGQKVAEDYRYRMAVKMQEGNLIVLDNSHLFDRAFDAVVADIQQRGRAASGGSAPA